MGSLPRHLLSSSPSASGARHRPRWRWLLLTGAALGWLTPGPAQAFCRTTTCRSTAEKACALDADGCSEGTPLVWPSRCVSYSLQAQGTQTLPPEETSVVLMTAFAQWSERPCPGGGQASLSFSPTDDVACKLPQANKSGPNVNVVFFRDDDWPYRGIDGTLATTTVSYDADGSIWDADIAINAAYNFLTLDTDDVDYDLRSIVTHEVGHFAGLAHSGDPYALMSPSYSPGELRRELSDDDVAGLCAAYPPGREASCDLLPRGGFSANCNENEESSGGCSVHAATGARGAAAQEVLAAAVGLVILAGRCRARRHSSPRSRPS